jgi:hypothetical protein
MQHWIPIFRDIVIPLAVALVAGVLSRKFGIEIKEAKRQRLSSIAFDAIMYAWQLSRSKLDPTPDTDEARQEKAREFGFPKVSDAERKELIELMESWIGKLKHHSVVVTTSASDNVVLAPSVPPPPSDAAQTIPGGL